MVWTRCPSPRASSPANCEHRQWRRSPGDCASSERTKGAEKASCGGAVVQEGVFESPFSSLSPSGSILKRLKSLESTENILLSMFAFSTTVSPHGAFSRENRRGGFWKGILATLDLSSNKPDVAIASKVSMLSKTLQKQISRKENAASQLLQKPTSWIPPHSRFPILRSFSVSPQVTTLSKKHMIR